MKIKSFNLFSNNNDKSKNIEKLVLKKMTDNGFIYDDENYDLAIAIGGDGSFLRMVKQTNFNSNIIYVGVNCGTLGFAQEIKVDNIDEFIEDLKKDNYKIEKIGIQETKILTNDSESNFYSLNEIVIRKQNLNTLYLSININDAFLEKYIGDGILIATSFGSTAYNLSFGGSIIYNTLHTLQITPIAPLNNKVYRNLLNSFVIPENKIITLKPEIGNHDLIITVDGENNKYDDVIEIKTFINKKRINLLRKKDYSFSKKINEKFLI